MNEVEALKLRVELLEYKVKLLMDFVQPPNPNVVTEESPVQQPGLF